MIAEKQYKVIPDFRRTAPVDQVGIEERASRFTKRSIKKETKLNGLLLALGWIPAPSLR